MFRKYYSTKNRKKFYNEFIKKQDGCCAICKSKERLVVDHAHKNGLMRGLLCYKHNTGLGFFNDNPDILDAAAAYLRENEQKHLEFKTSLPSTVKAKELSEQLLEDPSYPSDRARARVLASILGCHESAAQSRISRDSKQKRLKLVESVVIQASPDK